MLINTDETLKKLINVDETYVCLSVCVFVCVLISLTSDSSETVKVIIIKLDTVTASDMIVYHMLIILTLTFIQGDRS